MWTMSPRGATNGVELRTTFTGARPKHTATVGEELWTGATEPKFTRTETPGSKLPGEQKPPGRIHRKCSKYVSGQMPKDTH